LLRQPLPPLNKGKDILETIANPPSIAHHCSGGLAEWDNFKTKALEFYKTDPAAAELKRCAHAPIYMDPAIVQLNSKAMTVERLQTGAEITLSGRFFWNALAVTVHIVETLTNVQHGLSCHQGFLPSELTYGDSWIIEKPFRVNGQQPDAVLKLPHGSGHRLRMVGELKFCVTLDFTTMVKDADQGEGAKLRAILGKFAADILYVRTNI
jgi:hypothetical protein